MLFKRAGGGLWGRAQRLPPWRSDRLESEIRGCRTWRKCEMLPDDLQQGGKTQSQKRDGSGLSFISLRFSFAFSFHSCLLPSSIFPSLPLLPPSFLPCFIPCFLAFLLSLLSFFPCFPCFPCFTCFPCFPCLPCFPCFPCFPCVPCFLASFLPSFLASFLYKQIQKETGKGILRKKRWKKILEKAEKNTEKYYLPWNSSYSRTSLTSSFHHLHSCLTTSLRRPCAKPNSECSIQRMFTLGQLNPSTKTWKESEMEIGKLTWAHARLQHISTLRFST